MPLCKDDFVIVENVHRAWINAGWETKEMAQQFIDEYFELKEILGEENG